MAFRMSCFILIFLALLVCVNASTFYEVLGIKRNATPREVKKGYMKQVLKYHPDKNDSPDATEKFIEVTTAFECLGNPEYRKEYDNYGHEEYLRNSKQKKKRSRKSPQEDDPFSHFESFFKNEQENFFNDADDDLYNKFFNEFKDMFNGPGFGKDGHKYFHQEKVFDSDGIKMKASGFFTTGDIPFDSFWDGEEEEQDVPNHFGSGRSFFGGKHQDFSGEPHASHAQNLHHNIHRQHQKMHQQHQKMHQHHQNMHQQHQNMHQQHQNMHQQHQNMHQQHQKMHQQHHNMHQKMHQQHHNMHQQHHSGQKHQHQFHYQQEFHFSTSGDHDEEDIFGDGMSAFSNMFSDFPSDSNLQKQNSMHGETLTMKRVGKTHTIATKTFSSSSSETSSSSSSFRDNSDTGVRGMTCKMVRHMDSKGNMVENKNCF